jgi:N-succinyldiaminopimelate aminotransferase
MPRPGSVGRAARAIRGNPFGDFGRRLLDHAGEVYPFHVGDTWLEPPEGTRMQDLRISQQSGIHRYAPPRGHPVLVKAIAGRCGVPQERVLITAGATGALSALTRTLLDPGDEVLILAPYWPLIRGIVQAAHGVPVEVPFYDRPGTVEELLAARVTDRTVALYVNSPNNPTGRVLEPGVVRALAGFARQHDLWLLSDEVYEHYAFARPPTWLEQEAPERTFAVRSFSKAWGMAGNRVGWILGPADPAPLLETRKLVTHGCYQAPTAGQLAAARVWDLGVDWLPAARSAYEAAGYAAADALGLPRPEGGTFLFFDVADHLDERGLRGFLERCLDVGLLMAPGTSMGEGYETFVRLCFTCAPPEVVARGVRELVGVLGR